MTVIIGPVPIREFFEQLQQRLDEHNEKYEGWYCINIKPLTCEGCGTKVCYIEPGDYHLIIVWEEKDDPYLLKIAAFAKEAGAEPRVETYHPMLGACVAWEDCLRYGL